jgi:hypothetical protein
MPTRSGCLETKFTRRSPLCPPEARVVWAAVMPMPMPQTSYVSHEQVGSGVLQATRMRDQVE